MRRLLPALLCALLLACSSSAPPDARPVPSELPAAERETYRRLPVDGAHNLRDLGGYATADGRTTRWGMLFRSDALAGLTDDDLRYLERLRLRRVIDFRSALERERDPDRIPAIPGLEIVLSPIQGDALDPAELQERILGGEATAREMTGMLVDGNRAFVTDFSDVYADFLHGLADADHLPTLFHCTAGKDRAGFGAALALMAVGVPRETVMRDYLRTNEFSADHTERVLTILRFVSFFRTEPDDVRPLFEARREYLQTAFDTIDEKYGDTDGYLRQALGADDALLARIRTNLLE
ncbi:MAG: tyrosine-protein phosphatase [Myxococcota bacterium]